MLAASLEEGYLQQQWAKLLAPDPGRTVLLRENNRVIFKRVKVLWLDDGSPDSEHSLKAFLDTFCECVEVGLFRDFSSIQEQFNLPALVCLPSSFLREAVNFYYRNQERSLFFFVKSKHPEDNSSIFDKFSCISMIGLSYRELTIEMSQYLCPEAKLPLLDQKAKTQPRLRTHHPH